jgi:hypothetical protein
MKSINCWKKLKLPCPIGRGNSEITGEMRYAEIKAVRGANPYKQCLISSEAILLKEYRTYNDCKWIGVRHM